MLVFDGNGLTFVAAAGQSTTQDMHVPGGGLIITGGELITVGAAMGDYITGSIIDIDGVVAPPGTSLVNWLVKRYVSPGGYQTLKTGLTGQIPGLVYLRLVYTSVGLLPVAVAVNYDLDQVI